MKLAVNARFRQRTVTGVERYALEVTTRLETARSPGAIEFIEPKQPLAGLKGHSWEQAVLPWRFRGDVLFSPCNTGPLAIRKQVITLHDCAFLDYPEGFTRLFAMWYQWLMPRLTQRAAKILTVSEYSKSRIVECLRVPADKVHVIPNGVNAHFTPAAPEKIAEIRERFKLPPRYVLSVGSKEPRKNLVKLLTAWQSLASRHADVALVVVGAKNSLTFREAGITGEIPGVIQTGYVDHADLPAMYSGAELFVYPSLYEGFGLPVLEAMACGTAVVCSSTTSLPEVTGSAARLIDPQDAEAIADALDTLLTDSTSRRLLAAAGLQRAAEFSWDRTTRETQAVLEAVAQM